MKYLDIYCIVQMQLLTSSASLTMYTIKTDLCGTMKSFVFFKIVIYFIIHNEQQFSIQVFEKLQLLLQQQSKRQIRTVFMHENDSSINPLQ